MTVAPHCLCDCGGDYLDCDAGEGGERRRGGRVVLVVVMRVVPRLVAQNNI